MTSPGLPVRAMAAGALAAAAALITSCSGSGSPASAPTATVTRTASQPARPPAGATAAASGTTGASPTGPARAAGPQPCPTAALRAAVGSGLGAGGSSYYPVDFTNTSGTSCTLYGYPGVSFVTGAGGSQIGPAATRNNTVTPALVTLAAGQTAHATLQVVNAGNYSASQCPIVHAHWLRIYPPGQFTPLYVSFSAQTCGGGTHATRVLSVQTVAPGAAGQ